MVVDGEKEGSRATWADDLSRSHHFRALMPTLSLSSPLLKTTADGLSLVVGITHQLKLAVDYEPVLKIQKFPPPESLDILSSSSILLRLTGSFQGKRTPMETLQRSSLVAYLLEYLKFVWNDPAVWRIHSPLSHTSQHSAKLFIGNISDPYVNADGSLECARFSESFRPTHQPSLAVAIVSSRALLYPDELPVATATLIAISWSFAWESKSTEDTRRYPPQVVPAPPNRF